MAPRAVSLTAERLPVPVTGPTPLLRPAGQLTVRVCDERRGFEQFGGRQRPWQALDRPGGVELAVDDAQIVQFARGDQDAGLERADRLVVRLHGTGQRPAE